MDLKKNFLVGLVFTCALPFAVGKGIKLAHGQWNSQASQERVRRSTSELPGDAALFATDVHDLRESLRYRGNQEQIARLRYWVKQDWQQILADRVGTELRPWEPAPTLVNRRRQPSTPRG